MNWNDEINDIIRETLQILKRRQEAAQQQADIERLKAENERLRELLLDIRKDAATSHWHSDIDADLRQEV